MKNYFLLLVIISSVHCALKCDWEKKERVYLPGWVYGNRKYYTTLDEAKKVCLEHGDSCGGVTQTSKGYTIRSGTKYTPYDKETSWKRLCVGVRIDSIRPNVGSRTGGTRVTLLGKGFSGDQFSYDDESLGNKVIFKHKDNNLPSVECNVISYYTNKETIVCDMEKPKTVIGGDQEFHVRVAVDGTWISRDNTNVYCGGTCKYYFRERDTPYISKIPSSHMAAGSIMQFRGRIYSDSFAANESRTDQESYISRIYLNSLMCNPADADGTSYGSSLDLDKNGEPTTTGTIRCKSELPAATSYRMKFLNSKRGRSETRNVDKVDSSMRQYSVQTYNELTAISPASGGVNGGTKVTLTSKYLNVDPATVKVLIGNDACNVDSVSSDKIICTTSKMTDATLYPGNRGVKVDIWEKEDGAQDSDVRSKDPDLIKDFKTDAANFYGTLYFENTRPGSLYDFMDAQKKESISKTDVPYYVRMRFFLNIQQTDNYGFHMISEHSGKLYVSSDHDPANAKLVANCSSRHDNWKLLQTAVDTKLEAGKFYYVEFVGVMWNLKQTFGVGLTKAKTSFQRSEVSVSRIDFPRFYWSQKYQDEVQEVELGNLFKKPQEKIVLQIGDRETKTLYPSSNVETISEAISETADYKCPTIESADKYYSVSWENGNTELTGGWTRNYIKPFCGKWVAINTWTLFVENTKKKVYAWNPAGKYKWICFALKSKQPYYSFYYQVRYEDANYKQQTVGMWKGQDDTKQFLKMNTGDWVYNCVDMYAQVKERDSYYWDSKIGSRSWKITAVRLGALEKAGDYYTDAVAITTSNISAEAVAERVPGFALEGTGLLKDVKVVVNNTCPEGKDCVANPNEITARKWTITMDTNSCGYNFPLIKIKNANEQQISNDKYTYTVSGATVTVERKQAITPALLGTFDLTIDGVTHSNIPVDIDYREFLTKLNANADYKQVHKWGTCYNPQFRLERRHPGYYGTHSVVSTNVIAGIQESLTYGQIYQDNERGGLVLTPLYGDWIRTAESTPQVSFSVGGITSMCNATGGCNFAKNDNVPTVTAVSPTSGTTGQAVTLTGTAFGTTANKITVKIGDVSCAVTAAADTTLTCTVEDNVAKEHDISLNLDGVGLATVTSTVKFTFEGSIMGVSPKTGGFGGGTEVTVTGTGFNKDMGGVTFGGVQAKVLSRSYTALQVLTPPGTDVNALEVAVVVTGDTGETPPTTADKFTYTTNNLIHVTSFTPAQGRAGGGTEITFTGTSLDTVAENGVTINGVVCTKVSSTATEYKCTTGVTRAGEHSISIVSESGAAGYFDTTSTYTAVLKVTNMSPKTGSVVGGTELEFDGDGFGTNTSEVVVTLGQYGCKVTEVTDTKIKCKADVMQGVDGVDSTYEVEPVCFGNEGKLSDVEKVIQTVHNTLRSKHNNMVGKNICYDSDVAETAKTWANHLVKAKKLESLSSPKSVRLLHGENVMQFKDQWDLKEDAYYYRQAILMWYATGAHYDPKDPAKAAPYVQVVWSQTTAVGCAIRSSRADDTSPYTVYLVCHYNPAAVVEGDVGPFVSSYNSSIVNIVKKLPSFETSPAIFVKGYKATPSSSKKRSIRAATCSVTETVSSCSDATPTGSTSGIGSFTYYSCATPLIKSVASDQVFWDEDIVINGQGFSTQTCAVEVTLNNQHDCVVSAVTDTAITCKISPDNSPPIYSLMRIDVYIKGLGNAILEGTDMMKRHVAIKPKILSISPTKGSAVGGTVVTITGGGFRTRTDDDGNVVFDGSISDGYRSMKVKEVKWGEIKAETQYPGGNDLSAGDVAKNISLTIDNAPAECVGCDYVFEGNKTPNVTDVTPLEATAGTTITITGTNLCSSVSDDETVVTIGTTECVKATCTETEIKCNIPAMSADSYRVEIARPYGLANIPDAFRRFQALFSVTSVSPLEGSIYGGTTITIKGSNLPVNPTIKTGPKACKIVSATTSEYVIITPNRGVTVDETDMIWVETDDLSRTALGEKSYLYKVSISPTITSFTPVEGTLGTEVSIVGTSLKVGIKAPKVYIGETECPVKSSTETLVVCTLPNLAVGDYPIKITTSHGDSNVKDTTLAYGLKLTSTTPTSPTSGLQGGPAVTLKGAGFTDDMIVGVCGVNVTYQKTDTASITVNLPACPATVCTQASSKCSIEVMYLEQKVMLENKVTYSSANQPTITEISPNHAGTGGGKTITITGTNFGTDKSKVSVKFDGVSCTVTSATNTQIICTTGKKTDLANKDGVVVAVKEVIASNLNNKVMVYKDNWSSEFTWGGGDPPVAGDLVVIQKGQVITLDVKTPVLKALVIRGGSLVFDDSKDVELHMEYGIIVDGGSIHIGSEEKPFENNALIMMYGHQQSIELPIYGAKTLAVRNGTVEMHGKKVEPTWTRLAVTAEAGATSITIERETNWKVGDQLVIASTSFSPSENEEAEIKSLSVNGQKQTVIELTAPLKFKHIAVVQTIGGREIKTCAEVGHLTRNVKMMGNKNMDHLEDVEACPQAFDPDQFATQTCFRGRYGPEVDSDLFGAQIMFHAAALNTREVHGRLEYTEFSWSGQGFRLGRYPIHFHMNGDVSGSYVKGCSIYHTFNRAVTVHGVDNLLVKDNVAYDNMGHAYFLEDGIEENNTFERNLAVFTKTSSSSLNVDVTPASFWIVNPQNNFIGNAAAGGTHFGFWFNMPANPGGPSYTNTVCPRLKGIKTFKDNEAHSFGRYGIWVWEHWNPRGDGSCGSTMPNETTMTGFHAWHNLRGIEIEEGSSIRMDNFTVHDNWIAQVEVRKCKDATFEEGNTKLTNSFVVAKTKSSDGLKMDYMNNEEFKCGVGVVVPHTGLFSVHDTEFHDFTECPVFEACGGCRASFVGGFPNEFKGIKYVNSPVRGSFVWRFQTVFRDLDGTLANAKGGVVVPHNNLLDPSKCTNSSEWSNGPQAGVICQSTNLVRISFNKPSLEFLLFKKVFFTNDHGRDDTPYVFKRMTHKQGWMATLPIGYTYNMSWDYEYKFTNASFDMSAYYPKTNDWFILMLGLKAEPDYIKVGDKSNKKETEPESSDEPGTFHFNNDTKTLKFLVTGKGTNVTKIQNNNLKIYRCYYLDCINPNPTPLPLNPSISQRPDNPKRWSVSSDWKGTAEGLGGYNGILPKEGQDVIIPSSWWMIYDTDMVGLGNVTVYGVLEFSNEVDVKLGAKNIIVLGGKLVVGWKDEPITNTKAHILLTGNRDDTDAQIDGSRIIGSKALAVFGYLEMHAKVPSVVHTTITEKAAKGATKVVLKENVEEAGWKENDEIVIASTSYLGSQSEKRTIKSVEGHTVSFDDPLTFDHDYLLKEDSERSLSYERTAEVAHITRLITVEGADELGNSQRYGVRTYVDTYPVEGEDLKPVAKIEGVAFKNAGQEGYRDGFDPRYALAIKGCKPSEDLSYIHGCVVDTGYNHGFGLISCHNVDFEDNVVHDVLGSGLQILSSENTMVDGNCVINVKHYGNHLTPIEQDNYYVDACFNAEDAPTVTFKNNNCAGSERAGFIFQGEDVDRSRNENNVAHGCLWGVWIKKFTGSNSMKKVKLNKFYMWQNYDYGLLHYSKSSLVIQNSVFADNHIGAFVLPIGPNAITHEDRDMDVTYKNVLVYGRRPEASCDERRTDVNPTAKLSGIGYHAAENGRGGNLGTVFTSFLGGKTGWPKMSIEGPHTYNAVRGHTLYDGVTVVNFNRCNDIFMMDSLKQGDLHHPISLKNMKYENVDEKTGMLYQREPQLSLVNSADCVDMPCDARKKMLITDLDGSTFGKVTYLTSKSEFEWDGDKRWGTGDYRLPKPMKTAMDGSFISPDKWKYKGIDRDSDSKCTYKADYNMYQCTDLKYKLLVIESMDGDTEVRRLSPVAIATDDSVDLINGPQDHGWCGGYTCQQRVSTFHSMVITGKVYKIYLTNTQPQSIRYQLLNADANDKVLIHVWYSKPQRLDVYYKGKYLPPTNGKLVGDKYTFTSDKTADELTPKITSNKEGENFFNKDKKFQTILIKGKEPFTTITSPQIVLSLKMGTISDVDFFKENLVENLAALLNVPKEKIKIAKIVAESRKRDAGNIIEVEISEDPVASEDAMVQNVTSMATTLQTASEKLVETVQKGKLSEALKAEIKSVAVALPEIPPKDQRNETLDKSEAEKTGGKTYSEKQREEEEEKLAKASGQVEIKIPSKLQLVQSLKEVTAISSNGEFRSKVVTSSDEVVEVLGAGQKGWKAELQIETGPKNGRLLGTRMVKFQYGFGNITDIRFSKPGDYVLKVKVVYPTDFDYEVGNIEVLVTKQDESSPYRRVAFKFDAIYSNVVTDSNDFTNFMTEIISTRFPDLIFSDVDHYEGSLIVESTVTTSAGTKEDTLSKIDSMKRTLEEPFSIKYNGKKIALQEFQGDSTSSSGTSTTTVAIIVCATLVVALSVVAVGIILHKKKRERVLTTPIEMSSVKHVDDNPSLMRNTQQSNIYANPEVCGSLVRDANAPPADNTGLLVNSNVALSSVRDFKTDKIRSRHDSLKKLQQMSTQKVWGAMNRLDDNIPGINVREPSLDPDDIDEIPDKIPFLTFDGIRSRRSSVPRECRTCGQVKRTWPCPICNGPQYCSKECLDKNWANHQNECRPRSK